MELSRVQALTSAAGRALLDALPPYDEAQAFTLGAALREAGYEPSLVADALTQSRLRARAVEKFGEFAAGMLFTPDGLEQATRLDVAAHHAARFRAAGVGLVHDLGCGLGADSLAIGALGLAVRARDVDPAVAEIAAFNLRHLPDASAAAGSAEDALATFTGTPVRPGPGADRPEGEEPGIDSPVDAEAASRTAGFGVWLDPARRTPGRTDARGRTRRTHDLAGMSPSWETVLALAEAVPATGAKLAPSFPHAALPPGTEAQWVSRRGELLELALWWGPLATRPGRGALLLHPGRAPIAVTQADAPEAAGVAAAVPAPGDHLYDPDKAVLRAGLLGAVTAATGGAEVAEGAGYVVAAGRPRAVASGEVGDVGGVDTDAVAPDTPLARGYVITDVLPLHVKTLRAHLRERGVGRLTIKKRGPSVDADRLRADLRLSGKGAELTVVVTDTAAGARMLVVEPHADAPA